ncbi:MAG: DNA cytosine methyltransferase [bacterium]
MVFLSKYAKILTNNSKEGLIISTIQITSLFSGCGGLDLGFSNAGFNIVWANENNKKIWKTYIKNHPKTFLNTKSIKEVSFNEIPNTKGIIGGPPCQSWSLAGKMRGIKDKRGTLFFTYINILKAKNPDFFVIENVPGILSKTHLKEFLKIISLLQSIGYVVSYKKINSVEFGIPQTRQRVFIIGYANRLNKKFVFPKPQKKIITLRESIGDLPEPLAAKEKNITNGKVLAINGHEYYIGGFSSRYMSRNRHRGWDEPAYTIEASGRHAKIHPSSPRMIKINTNQWEFNPQYIKQYRRLSIRESARIQTFPDSFDFLYKKLNDGYKMVGNAVPVQLAKQIASIIINDLY